MLEKSMSAPPSIWDSFVSWFTPTVLFVFLNLMIGTLFITSSLNKHSHDPNKQREQDDGDARPPPQVARSPSMLQRLKSVKFYAYSSQGPEKSPDSDTHFAPHQTHEPEQIDFHPQSQPPLSGSPSVLQRLKSIYLQSYFSQEPTSPFDSQPQNSQDTSKTHSDSEEENEMEGETGEERGQNKEEKTLEEVYSQLKGTQVSRTKFDTKPASGEIPTKLPRKMGKSASTKSAFAHYEEEDIVEKWRPATVREGNAKAAAEVDEEVDAKADDFINRFKQQLKLQRIDSIIGCKETIGRGSGK